jgi:hypothetical protein
MATAVLTRVTDFLGITLPATPAPEGLPKEYLLGENDQMLMSYPNVIVRRGPQSHSGVRVVAVLDGRHMDRLLAELAAELGRANGRAFVLGDYSAFLDTVGNAGFTAWVQETNWRNPAFRLPETDFNIECVYRLGVMRRLSLAQCRLLTARVFGHVPPSVKAVA